MWNSVLFSVHHRSQAAQSLGTHSRPSRRFMEVGGVMPQPQPQPHTPRQLDYSIPRFHQLCQQLPCGSPCPQASPAVSLPLCWNDWAPPSLCPTSTPGPHHKSREASTVLPAQGSPPPTKICFFTDMIAAVCCSSSHRKSSTWVLMSECSKPRGCKNVGGGSERSLGFREMQQGKGLGRREGEAEGGMGEGVTLP